MLQGIKGLCLNTPAIPGGRLMTNGSEMFAPAVLIMVNSGCEAELTKANEYSGEVRYVNGDFNYHCSGVVVARWWGLGILTLAQLAPGGNVCG